MHDSPVQPGATNAAGSSQGDMLDRGVGMAGKQFGKDLSREDQEKYSDYARQGFQKGTGRVCASIIMLLSLVVLKHPPTGCTHQGSEHLTNRTVERKIAD